MIFPKFYNKKLKHGIPLVLTASFIVLSLNGYISDDINQFWLESQGLYLNKQSQFNPRDINYAVYSYLNSFNSQEVIDYSYIGNDTGIYFHWDDWVDLFPAKKILDRYRHESPEGECDSVIRNFADVNGYFMESYSKKVLRGMADLYCLKDIPKRVIISTDKSMIEIPVIGKKRLGETRLPSNINKAHLVNEMLKIQKTNPNENNLKFKSKIYKQLEKSINVKSEDFAFNVDFEMFKLKERLNNGTITNSELGYLQFLEYSNYLVDKSDRYFKYPWIITDVLEGKSHHLAYPFFKRFISDRERQSIIHHMVRVWFQFAEANGFASWINYGSLLGWAYNGVNMPWDTDVDIQMPIVQLDRLGREFNRSIIIENPRYGNSKYFLEIAPTYTKQGNGKNFIDARFIDINSGLYIDISALAHTDYKPPKSLFKDLTNDEKLKAMTVHCKNWNWHTLDELLPIRHTYFEGGSVYIPNNVSRILTRKYGEESITTKLHYMKHNFQKDINLWVPDRICANPPSVDRFEAFDRSKITFEGACNKEYLQDEYQINFECSQRHLSLNENIDSSIAYIVEGMDDLPIFRKDAWDYYNDINENIVNSDRWYVREEIVR